MVFGSSSHFLGHFLGCFFGALAMGLPGAILHALQQRLHKRIHHRIDDVGRQAFLGWTSQHRSPAKLAEVLPGRCTLCIIYYGEKRLGTAMLSRLFLKIVTIDHNLYMILGCIPCFLGDQPNILLLKLCCITAISQFPVFCINVSRLSIPSSLMKRLVQSITLLAKSPFNPFANHLVPLKTKIINPWFNMLKKISMR